MEFIKTSKLSNLQIQEIYDLWNNEYPQNLNYLNITDFEDYLKNLNQKSHLLLVNEKHNIVGWYVDFIRENEKWFVLIVHAEYQGKGLGRKILNIAKEKEIELNAWVIDHSKEKKKTGNFYNSPLDFYIKNGFEIMPKIRLELKKISAVKISWKRHF